ncbi:hypothetical protein BT93_L5878 [Corymbia citriodora subsp. variegata]|uniref:glucan endo-1,3-beta-D-glucosidase n=1 Tax=Corymbia citriodora subsp. variegata TaxID=360336 RepID=A0A8T0CR66_CORYI|nr:hypothetical protein BT93_L5878 [Corymbia citriodora subsp. variegata]
MISSALPPSNMALRLSPFLLLLLLLLLISGLASPAAMAGPIGVNYGQIANNLPPPDHAVALVKSIGATRVKLYDADLRVLCAFAHTGVEFTVGLGNEFLAQMKDPKNALSWVKTNVQSFLPDTNITTIAVGNEVFTSNDTSLRDLLMPAMKNVHDALASLGLDKQVTVTTAHSLALLETSYPPSTGRFRRDLVSRVSQVLDFQCQTGSSFLINAYPYFAYKANPKQVPLDFVLFQSSQGITDPSTGLTYENMLFAQIDAVHSALAAVGYANMTVHVSETGWPSRGDDDEVGATPENAKKYNGNLIKIVKQKKGTPMKPNYDLNIYVFALFNENMKPGPMSERNYGLFKPDGTPSYMLSGGGGGGGMSNGTSSGGSGGGGSASDGSPPAPIGYLSVSSGASELQPVGAACLVLALFLIKLVF